MDPFRIEMPHWPQPLWHTPPGAPLERMRRVLARLGNPQERLPPVIQVAGTNGKGSTIAFLRAMLEAAGYRVHAYTSPHLHRFAERIRLQGRLIGEAELTRALEATRAACGEDIPVTFFEGTTAAAYLAMSQSPADIALIETGMGGRDDPTNLLPTAILSLITPIDYDHTEFLGPTLAEIAAHKAGILKAGIPAIIGPQGPEALAVIARRAEEIGAPLLVHGRDWAAERAIADGQEWLRYADAHGEAALPMPALAGEHQAINAGMAIAALTTLEDFTVEAEAVVRGLAEVQWPGRLERITQGALAAALPLGWELWMDGGHNPHGAQAVAHHLASAWTDKPTTLIFGTTRGKELAPMLAPLLAQMQDAWAVPVRAEPKCYGPQEILQAAQGLGAMQAAQDVAEAVRRCVETHAAPHRILVFGSLYLRVECVHG